MFRSAFDEALVGMTLIGIDGRYVRVNAVFAAMIGREPEDLVGREFSEVTHPDDAQEDVEAVQSAMTGEAKGLRRSKRYRHSDGSTVYAELSTSLVRDRDGEPLHFATQYVDVTARRRAQRERDTHDLMLRGVIANSQSLIYVKDLEGRYLLTNPPFERAFSVTAAELLGRDDTYLDPELAPIWRVNDLRAQREEYRVEEWSDGPDGRQHYESVKFPLRDPDGVVYATCGVSLDVTRSRRAAEEMEHARDAALAATTAKSSFLATMSHEIRTPMNAVIGMTGLLLDTELDDQQREFVETVRTSGDALLSIINDILDFSSLEAREVELESAAFELQSCLDEALSLVAPAAGRLDLVAHVDPRCPPTVLGDMYRLRQVLLNLLANAVKFTEEGDVLVSVAPADAGTADPAPGALTFSVRDTGIGIPADRMDRLFRSFSQVDASTTRMYGGSGLGLAISRAIIEAMGGTITVRSTVGEGSTFSFDVVLPAAPYDPAVADAAPAADLTGRRVLIVDDNETNRRILRLQLENAGVQCVDVSGGTEALGVLSGGARFNLAILDMHMPGMDGQQLAERIRSLPGPARLPLMLLTSLASRPATAGLFDAFHSKPVRAAVLRNMIGDVLGAPAAPPRAQEPAAALTEDRPLRVLLAEDNQVNQTVGRLMLANLGHTVDIAGNGREALHAASTCAYDVVLMDIHMPIMDGLQATRAIREQLPPDQQPRIIAMTASCLAEDRRDCAAAGMDDYLLKPVRLEHLAVALRSAAHGRTPAGSGLPALDPADGVRARLDELLGQDPDTEPLRRQLLDALLHETPGHLQALSDAVLRGDASGLTTEAHTLKGMSANLGAQGLASLCGQLEDLGREGDLREAPDLIGRLQTQHDELCHALA